MTDKNETAETKLLIVLDKYIKIACIYCDNDTGTNTAEESFKGL